LPGLLLGSDVVEDETGAGSEFHYDLIEEIARGAMRSWELPEMVRQEAFDPRGEDAWFVLGDKLLGALNLGLLDLFACRMAAFSVRSPATRPSRFRFLRTAA
jgi:hypothetical protein